MSKEMKRVIELMAILEQVINTYEADEIIVSIENLIEDLSDEEQRLAEDLW